MEIKCLGFNPSVLPVIRVSFQLDRPPLIADFYEKELGKHFFSTSAKFCECNHLGVISSRVRYPVPTEILPTTPTAPITIERFPFQATMQINAQSTVQTGEQLDIDQLNVQPAMKSNVQSDERLIIDQLKVQPAVQSNILPNEQPAVNQLNVQPSNIQSNEQSVIAQLNVPPAIQSNGQSDEQLAVNQLNVQPSMQSNQQPDEQPSVQSSTQPVIQSRVRLFSTYEPNDITQTESSKPFEIDDFPISLEPMKAERFRSSLPFEVNAAYDDDNDNSESDQDDNNRDYLWIQ